MPRKPFKGVSRKLLLAFDVGTTFSGISYSIMDPDQVPEIRPVTRYPGHPRVGADCKIPTEIFYDSSGKVRAIGAEASKDGIEATADDEGWIKSKWFKMHLRPRGQQSNMLMPAIPPLPPNKTVVQVFADFVKYLFDCARDYIQQTHANGVSLWDSVSNDIVYVFTHPNGWEGAQQTQMREAAIIAGLITNDSKGKDRITFVTEGEASLHFCINNGLAPGALENGDGIVIVDAGGGTIDISAYKGQGDAFHETAIPQCHFQGSIFVTTRAKTYLDDHLKESRFEDDVPHIVQLFDKGAKLTFRDKTVPHYIRFGPTRESDAGLGIRNGQLRLTGVTVAGFFEPSIACIVKAVKEQVAASHHPTKHILLVGGFAASDWLFQGVKEGLEREGLQVSRPDSHVNKAVSDGAAAFYLDHYVESRVSRVCYGTLATMSFNSKDPEHVRRKDRIQISPNTGLLCFVRTFSTILPKGEQVRETKEFRDSFSRCSKTLDDIYDFHGIILSYHGQSKDPIWMWEELESYTVVGFVEADLRGVEVREVMTTLGLRYMIDFEIVLLFGLTELKAQFAWTDSGVEKRGSAEVLFDPNQSPGPAMLSPPGPLFG